MEMQVLHRLAGLLAAVGHHTVAFPAMLGADFCNNRKNVGNDPGIFRGQLPGGADMLLGDDEKMAGRLGVQVIKGQHLFVFVQLVRWDLSRRDLAENTHEEGLLSVDMVGMRGGLHGGAP